MYLILTTIGALLSAIGIAGIDRVVRANVLAKSGRAVEVADTAIERLAEVFGIDPEVLYPDYTHRGKSSLKSVCIKIRPSYVIFATSIAFQEVAKRAERPYLTVHYLIQTKTPPVAAHEQLNGLARALGVKMGELLKEAVQCERADTAGR